MSHCHNCGYCSCERRATLWLFFQVKILRRTEAELLDRCKQFARYAWRANAPVRLGRWEQRKRIVEEYFESSNEG